MSEPRLPRQKLAELARRVSLELHARELIARQSSPWRMLAQSPALLVGLVFALILMGGLLVLVMTVGLYPRWSLSVGGVDLSGFTLVIAAFGLVLWFFGTVTTLVLAARR